jgi:purine-binding chemotaxis protein CheW
MDLADIRKKANPQKTANPGEGLPPDSSPPSTPEGPAMDFWSPEPVATPEVPSALFAPSFKEVIDNFFNNPFQIDSIEGGDSLDFAKKDQDDKENYIQWLTFAVGGEEYAIELNSVSEIIKPRDVTDIPRVPDFILGIISLRGIIVPIYDLARRLKLGSVTLSPQSRIIVCQEDDRMIGLLVDGITQVARISEKKIELPPAVLADLDRDFVSGVGRYQGRMLILLKLCNVFNPDLS